MKLKIIILLVFMGLSAASLFSQQQDLSKIPFEIKTPVNILGLDEGDDIFFDRVRDIKYNPVDKKIYIADAGNDRIVVMDEDMHIQNIIGRKGQGPGEFNHPYCLSFSKNNNLVVLEQQSFRIQILTLNGDYISSFSNKSRSNYFAINMEDRIVIGNQKKDALFLVIDFDGNEIFKFGESLDRKERPSVVNRSNYIMCEVDKQGNIFGAFENHSILRKYNKEHKLVFEIKFEDLPESKFALEKWEKEELPEIKQVFADNPSGFEMASKRKYLVYDLSLGMRYIYLLLHDNGVYLLDKNTGEFIKRIKFDIKDELGGSINKIGAESPEYFYGYNGKNGVLVKFHK